MTFVVLHLLVWFFSLFKLVNWLASFTPSRLFRPFNMLMQVGGHVFGYKTFGLTVLALSLFFGGR